MAAAAAPHPHSPSGDRPAFDLNLQHGHRDLVQAVAFNTYGDRCATGTVDGKIRVFNRHKDATWRLCDTWTAHGGEVLEVRASRFNDRGGQGLADAEAHSSNGSPRPSTPTSSPRSGRRFCAGRSVSGRPAFDTRSSRAPYRSFSVRHDEETRHTYLALLATDGRLTVFENDEPENLSEYAAMDDFSVCARPARGEEVSFKVRFDPGPEPCYAALRAGVPSDALGLIVAAMDSVKVYRSRDVVTASMGVSQTQKEFYLAADIPGHRGLVRDVAWAPGNIRGYDIIATACQDGYARVFRLDTPYSPADGKSWSSADLLKPAGHGQAKESPPKDDADGKHQPHHPQQQQQQQQHSHPSTLSASLAKSGAQGDRHWSGQPGQVKHTFREISRLDSHRTPVWRIGFDDDGQILGSTGDDGRLLCYRQTPDGAWAKSSELVMMKSRMAVP
ncbi:hypothetical protein HIM_02568 [Hirsutella minnesotensis 3608]|nr:hypothetical protein HIM_02568 [Hirsutella minnesotensis 3608]